MSRSISNSVPPGATELAGVQACARRGHIRALCAVIGLALLLRLVFCFVAIPKLNLPIGPAKADFYTGTDGYMALAGTLYEHGKLAFAADQPATVFRLPAFPLAIAGMYALAPDLATATMLVNCITSAVAAGVVYLFAALVFERPRWPVRYAAALLPLSIYYCSNSFSDTFISFALIVYAYALAKVLTAPSLPNGLVAGLTFILATLSKPMLAPLPFVLLPYVAFRRRAALAPLLLSLLVGLAGMGLWTLRNYHVSGRFVPLATGGGFNLLIGTHMTENSIDCTTSFKYGARRTLADVSAATGRRWENWELRPAGHIDISPELDETSRKIALALFRAEPGLLLRKVGVNALRFWYLSSSPWKSLASAWINFPMLVLAGFGMWNYRRQAGLVIGFLLVLLAVYVGAYCLVLVHSTRFAIPALMLLAPFAAQSLCDAWSNLRHRHESVARV